jgi:hypothetical protein
MTERQTILSNEGRPTRANWLLIISEIRFTCSAFWMNFTKSLQIHYMYLIGIISTFYGFLVAPGMSALNQNRYLLFRFLHRGTRFALLEEWVNGDRIVVLN